MNRLSLCFLFLLPISLRSEESKPSLSPEQTRQAFLKLLDRPKVPADHKSLSESKTADGIATEHFSIATEKKADGTIERMPVLLVKPVKEGKLPVVILLHGTGGNKEGMQSWLTDFAKRGFIAVAIDARYHGERVPNVKGSAAYVEAIAKAWKTPKDQPQEHPFYYDTVWDLWRLMDYLETRPDVDAKKIGMLGISMGGIQTWLCASVDERVQVALPLIGVQSFKWSLENEKWQGRANTIKAAHEAAAKDLGEKEVNSKVCQILWSKVIPGILDDFDCPKLLPLFAGRALFIANGTEDPNCPIEGARIAIDAAEKAFDKSKNRDKLKVMIEDVKHTVTPEARKAAIEFCEKWLK